MISLASVFLPAPMFDERGQGLILRGGWARTDKFDRARGNYLQYFPTAFSTPLWNVPSGNLSTSKYPLQC